MLDDVFLGFQKGARTTTKTSRVEVDRMGNTPKKRIEKGSFLHAISAPLFTQNDTQLRVVVIYAIFANIVVL